MVYEALPDALGVSGNEPVADGLTVMLALLLGFSESVAAGLGLTAI